MRVAHGDALIVEIIELDPSCIESELEETEIRLVFQIANCKTRDSHYNFKLTLGGEF